MTIGVCESKQHLQFGVWWWVGYVQRNCTEVWTFPKKKKTSLAWGCTVVLSFLTLLESLKSQLPQCIYCNNVDSNHHHHHHHHHPVFIWKDRSLASPSFILNIWSWCVSHWRQEQRFQALIVSMEMRGPCQNPGQLSSGEVNISPTEVLEGYSGQVP